MTKCQRRLMMQSITELPSPDEAVKQMDYYTAVRTLEAIVTMYLRANHYDDDVVQDAATAMSVVRRGY